MRPFITFTVTFQIRERMRHVNLIGCDTVLVSARLTNVRVVACLVLIRMHYSMSAYLIEPLRHL